MSSRFLNVIFLAATFVSLPISADEVVFERDERLDKVDFKKMPLSCLLAGTRFVLRETDTGKIPIGVSNKADENPKVVVTEEIPLNSILGHFGVSTSAILEKPETRQISAFVESCYPKSKYPKEHQAVSKKLFDALSDLKTKYLRFDLMDTKQNKLESEEVRQNRVHDTRKPLKWYTWFSNIGKDTDQSLVDGFTHMILERIPDWYPSQLYSKESFRKARPEEHAFQINHQCLKEKLKPIYEKLSVGHPACNLEFKKPVKKGSQFDPQALGTIQVGLSKTWPNGWVEFPIQGSKYQALSCRGPIKMVSDLGKFIDLKQSPLKADEKCLPPKPTVAPTQKPAPKKPAPKKASPKKPTTGSHPALTTGSDKNLGDESGIVNQNENEAVEVAPAQ